MKNENRKIKFELGLGGGNNNINNINSPSKKEDINFRGSANNFFIGNNNMNSPSNKILVELLSGQNIIKDYIKDIMDKTNELFESNNKTNLSSSQNTKTNKNSVPSSDNKDIKESSNNNHNNKITNHKSSKNVERTRRKEKTVKENIIPKKEYIDYSTFNNTSKIPSSNSLLLSPNNKTNNNSLIEIKISNSVLKRDLTGKPFLEYICNIKNGSDIYSINKKFGHFMLLHKAIKNSVNDSVQLPDSGSLFLSINDMKQNTFHENKLGQLDKYINDLTKIEQVMNCSPFRNFFELDENHDNKNTIRKNKTIMDKRRSGKLSSSTLQRNLEDFQV